MRHTAEIYDQLTGKKITEIEFDDSYGDGLKKPEPLAWLAKCAAANKGVRGTQWVDVKNIKAAGE